jgi:PAS domain S-box-containing protein
MTAPEKSLSSFNYLDSLLKNAQENAILLIETNGTIVAINKAFTECFGYREKDIIGKSSVILFTEEDREKGLPQKELANVLATGQANDNNYLVNKNKESVWVSGESILVTNDKKETIILKIIQNIHEQKSAEIAIRRLNVFNENILKTIKDAVIVLDEKMAVVKANDAFLNLIRKEDQQTFSLNFADFLKQYDTNDTLLKDLQHAIVSQTGFSNKLIEIETSAGNKTFTVAGTPLLNSDSQNLLLVIYDITISKELEKEREDIIGFVTHELRNPLSTLSLSNEIMREAVKENNLPLVTKVLVGFENNVRRMNKMIAGLYESTKVNSGYFLLETSEFDFGEMVKEAVNTIVVLHPSFNIIVNGNAGFPVVADRYRLIQVISNYLSNAIKYSNGNKEITLTVHRDQSSVTVSVKDNGLGISKEHLPYVFERFFRIKKTRKIEGIGLGLYLCRQIILAHKGQVWVESQENKESVFYFSIPLQPSLVNPD